MFMGNSSTQASGVDCEAKAHEMRSSPVRAPDRPGAAHPSPCKLTLAPSGDTFPLMCRSSFAARHCASCKRGLLAERRGNGQR